MIRTAPRLASVAAALVLLATSPVLAQTAQPTESQLALAREVAVSSGMTRSFDALTEPFFAQLQQMNVTRPEIRKDLDEVVAIIRPEVEQQKGKLIESAARAFASRFTEAELKEIAVFYRSPAGKKYVEVQPGLLDDIVKDLATWTQNMSEYIMIRARAEMGKRGHQLQ
ncbi:DUF2059 domain-containing protein [Microvirga thermotolerans]|uniref:DUF2059 domain-containing protein n=1 Tax=Microvirga thermotolerans TaxID=2651334 RepID=A0A5P9JW47_9HYPH|nr:DUF2059 domain-containing protein [Microvirga thermotolerans]QFU17032.1 DUF2059 domain-containing protein [Microvirga thermotolerans]